MDAKFVAVIEQHRDTLLDLIGGQPSFDVPKTISGADVLAGDVGDGE